MNRILLSYLLAACFFLAGCGSSPVQATATPVPPTEIASPTQTIAPSPTSTPAPTDTPVDNSLAEGTIIDHASFESERPKGLPNNQTSEYLETASASFSLLYEDSFTLYYLLSFDVKQTIPNDAYIEIHFEDPLDPASAIVVPVKGPFSDRLDIQSPNLTSLECQAYWVEVHIYRDTTKAEELGTHFQWIRAGLAVEDITQIKDPLAVFQLACP